jgi:hypothetical protein
MGNAGASSGRRRDSRLTQVRKEGRNPGLTQRRKDAMKGERQGSRKDAKARRRAKHRPHARAQRGAMKKSSLPDACMCSVLTDLKCPIMEPKELGWKCDGVETTRGETTQLVVSPRVVSSPVVPTTSVVLSTPALAVRVMHMVAAGDAALRPIRSIRRSAATVSPARHACFFLPAR